MLAQLAQCGVAPSQCKAKIFGGGNMFPAQRREGAINVGQRNGEAARALLHDHGIPVVSEGLFGVGHRQVIFVLGTGDVWSNQIKPSGPSTTQELL
jgi:chemotaxis protein CheD